MKNKKYNWEITAKLKTSEVSSEKIVTLLLKNRGLKTEKEKHEFLFPTDPEKIPLKSVGIKQKSLKQTIERIKKALDNKEKIIVYGDYDADGISATAVLWEVLNSIKADVMPYIPDRFSEGYGLNAESIEKFIVSKYPGTKLIITVDNGIVANEAVEKANALGIDVIITDHHQAGKKLPKAFSIVHTTILSGAGIAWFLAREIRKIFKHDKNSGDSGLELAAIGTIADQIPLVGPNRSIAKHGLDMLNKTTRPGLLCLYESAGINRGDIGAYHVGFVISPRINAMGRLEHALDSLRFLCTRDINRAKDLSNLLNKTNIERQAIVEKVVLHAKEKALLTKWKGVILLSDESYHEGIIGLAASRLTEEFYRPAIVVSKGEVVSKASARSVPGFNIIEAIRKMDSYLLGGGGHPMAAGFSIETAKLSSFASEFEKVCEPLLTEEILTKRLKLDMVLEFALITKNLAEKLKQFSPTGLGNPTPSFATLNVKVIEVKKVGREGKHLKLKLEKDNIKLETIGFGLGELGSKLTPGVRVDVAYTIDVNIWNGNSQIQLKIKDIKEGS